MHASYRFMLMVDCPFIEVLSDSESMDTFLAAGFDFFWCHLVLSSEIKDPELFGFIRAVASCLPIKSYTGPYFNNTAGVVSSVKIG